MKTISLCMIIKNEELTLDRVLSQAQQFADEIIIVDTGSVDTSVDIAKKYTDKIFSYKWEDNFADARNYSFSKATCDYVMWLDADDVVYDADIKKINNLKQTMIADMYMLRYNVGFDGEHVTHWFYRERIMRRECGYRWHGCVHECITPSGNIEYLDIAINHKKIKQYDRDRNISIYENKLKTTSLDARETYYYARELFYHARFKECIKYMRKFFKMNGFIENIIDGHIIVSDCYEKLKQHSSALHELYLTFDYSQPRANICCKIGDLLLAENKYNIAIFWYNSATKCINTDKKGGFVNSEYYNYYPYIQMCVCYYNLGNMEEAEYYNNLAGATKPDDWAYLHNKKFFDKNKL